MNNNNTNQVLDLLVVRVSDWMPDLGLCSTYTLHLGIQIEGDNHSYCAGVLIETQGPNGSSSQFNVLNVGNAQFFVAGFVGLLTLFGRHMRVEVLSIMGIEIGGNGVTLLSARALASCFSLLVLLVSHAPKNVFEQVTAALEAIRDASEGVRKFLCAKWVKGAAGKIPPLSGTDVPISHLVWFAYGFVGVFTSITLASGEVVSGFGTHWLRQVPFTRPVGKIPSTVMQILVGTMLGDGSARMGSGTACVIFGQCGAHLNYLLSLWYVLWSYGYATERVPYVRAAKAWLYEDTGVTMPETFSARFSTLMLASLVPFFKAWYPDLPDGTPGPKGVPVSLVAAHFTPLAIAIWFCDDGMGAKNGLFFCTDCFTAADVTELMRLFKSRYGIETTLRKSGRIYIRSASAPAFIRLIQPHMEPSMLRKFTKKEYPSI